MPQAQRPKQGSPRLSFEVTAEQIEEAIQRDSGHCMIAEAITAAYPHAKYVSVDLATIRVTDTDAGWRYIYLTPRRAQDALLAFDQGEPVEPFRATISAAQMIATGTARNARRHEQNQDEEAEPANAAKPRRRGKAAVLVQPPGTKGTATVGVKVGGIAPAVGPLSNTKMGRPKSQPGRRREYGLRAYIR